jgi:hypothetical protein
MIGWLFSIGFLKMSFWKGVLALFIWPYFMGVHFAPAEPASDAEHASPADSE